MKRREILTAIAAAPLLAMASTASAVQKKKEQGEPVTSAPSQEQEILEEVGEACKYEKSVEDVVATYTKPGSVYRAHVVATVIVPPPTATAEWSLSAVTACVERTSDHMRWGPATMVEDPDDFADPNSYIPNMPFYLPGAVAGQQVIAKVLAVYQVKLKGSSTEATLP